METKVEEIWKPIPGLEGRYEASTLGRIKNSITSRIINGESNKGYRRLEIWNFETKKSNRLFAHRLILQTFVPNPNNKPMCNHKNGIRSDNRVSNLEWATAKENIQHAVSIGLFPIGQKHKDSKLTDKKVLEIRTLINEGRLLHKEIAASYGIATSGVHKIKTLKTWKHLPF